MSVQSFENEFQFGKQVQECQGLASLRLIDEFSQKFISYPTNDSETQFIDIKQYNKLQELLQNREASIRLLLQHKHQLRINIENLKQKNQLIGKSHLQMMHFYQDKVAALKRQNQTLRKAIQKEPSAEFKLKTYLNSPIIPIQINFNLPQHLQPKQKINNLLIQQKDCIENGHIQISTKKLIQTSIKSTNKHLTKRSQSLTPIRMFYFKSNQSKGNLLPNKKNHNDMTTDSKESFRKHIKLIIQKQKNQSLTRVSQYTKLRQAQKYRDVEQNLVSLKSKSIKMSKKSNYQTKIFKPAIKQDKKIIRVNLFDIKKCCSLNLQNNY